jgi:type IV pilus assembly protein PilA
MKNMKNKQAGFSLIELMVVVAIIGILATIAVPNFQRFQAKAKQSNAKVELSGVYTAEKAFFTEYSSYFWHLPAVGFLPEGFGTGAGQQANSSNNVTGRYYATTAGAAGGNWPAQLGAVAPTTAAYNNFTYANSRFNATATVCAAANGAVVGAVPTTAPDIFTAVSQGCPRSPTQITAAGPTQTDVWSMDQNKTLLNTRAGI